MYTQYADVLSAVAGTGNYTFTTDYACPFKPWTVAATYTSILGSPLGIANDFTGGLGYEVQAPHDTGLFSGSIVTTAGPDLAEASYTTDLWDIWTKEAVVVNITTNELTKVDTGTVTAMTWTNTEITDANDWATTHVLTVTGNVTDANVTVYNQIRNYGDTYETGASDYYTEKFSVDVRWIDTTTTVVNTSSVATGVGFEDILLSGNASAGVSDASAWHADWTLDDDEFRIVKFSGYNTTLYNYPGSTTAYNADLDALYTNTTEQSFEMTKTVRFTESWSGFVIYSDIAGNTGEVFVDVTVIPQADFDVVVRPAFRKTANDYSSTGDFWIYENVAGTWNRLHNSMTEGATYSGLVTDALGSGTLTIATPANGNEYMVVYKAEGMLAIGYTGVWENDITDFSTNVFDLTSGAVLTTNFGASTAAVYPDLTYGGVHFIKQGDVDFGGANGSYDVIDGSVDGAAINYVLTIGTPTHLDYYDFDMNGVVNVIEQSVELQFDLDNGFIDEYADGVTYPSKLELTGL